MGIDIFDGSYAYKATERGRAITMKFGDVETTTQETMEKTINLWDPNMAHSFEPIDPNCGCYTCSTPHSKAYIHHLLNAHEMLGPLLLMRLVDSMDARFVIMQKERIHIFYAATIFIS